MHILFPLVLPFFLCDVVAGSIHRPRGLLRERVGGELNRKGDYSSDDTDDGATNGHEFPTAIHSPAAFGFDVDDASVNLDDIFTPAASLDVFKNVRTNKVQMYDVVTNVFDLVATFDFILKLTTLVDCVCLLVFHIIQYLL